MPHNPQCRPLCRHDAGPYADQSTEALKSHLAYSVYATRGYNAQGMPTVTGLSRVPSHENGHGYNDVGEAQVSK